MEMDGSEGPLEHGGRYMGGNDSVGNIKDGVGGGWHQKSRPEECTTNRDAWRTEEQHQGVEHVN